jgi:hypothetical protein
MYHEELTEIAKTIWESTIGLPLSTVASVAPLEEDERSPAAELITVRVRVSGAWNGSVSATLSSALGRRVASAMLQLDIDRLSPADVTDSLLEVVNMVGGNFKALLPPVCRLALPELVTQRSQAGGTLEATASFDCEREPLDISVRTLPAAASEHVSGADRSA